MFKVELERTIDDLLLKRMELIVKRVVTKKKFQSDFFIHDVREMKTCDVFAWLVYKCGTHMVPLHNMQEVIKFKQEWLDTLAGIKDRDEDESSYQLYLINVPNGDLKRVYHFKTILENAV